MIRAESSDNWFESLKKIDNGLKRYDPAKPKLTFVLYTYIPSCFARAANSLRRLLIRWFKLIRSDTKVCLSNVLRACCSLKLLVHGVLCPLLRIVFN